MKEWRELLNSEGIEKSEIIEASIASDLENQ